MGPRPPSSRTLAPALLRAYQLPSPTAALPPLQGAPASAGAQQWALHAAAAAAGQRPGPQGHKAARPPRPPASRHPRRGPTRERLTFPEPARPRAPPSLCLWQTWLAEKRAPSPPPPPPLPSGLPSCPAPGPLPALARSLALRSPRSLPPRRWLRALSSCQSVSPGRGPIALELLPRRLGLSCAAARPMPAARLLAAPRARRPGSACAALCAFSTAAAAAAAAAGLLGAQPNVAAPAGARRASTPRDGRPRRPIGARGRARRPRGTPVSGAAPVPLRLLREPLPARAPARGAGGEPWRWGGAATRGARAWTGAPGRRGGDWALRQPARTLAGPARPFSRRPSPQRPRLPVPSAGQDPGRPCSPLRPTRAVCAQPCLPSPGQCYTRSWAAEAGAKARGCFFTRSLKYFGKPQSGAARKWPLACSRQAVGGETGLELEGKSDFSQISEVC